MNSSKRLKILFLSRWVWEENRRTGGTGTAQQLAEALAILDHEVVILSQSPEVKGLERNSLGVLEMWLTPREKRHGGWTGLRDKISKQFYKHRKVHSDVADLAKFVKERGPFDVIFAQSEEPDGLIAGLAVMKGIPLPPIVTQIQALRYIFKKGEQRFSEQAALGVAFKYATLVLANSKMVAEDIAKHYAKGIGKEVLEEKTRVLPHNLTRTFLASADALQTQIMPEKARVLFLGAINEKKGPLVFLKSLPFCCAAAPKSGVTFAVAGSFTENNPSFARKWTQEVKTTQDQLSSLSKAITIEQLGKLDGTTVLREIKRASVVVMPSLYDEFSRAVAEALASGRPVITTNKVGAAELITGQEMPSQTDLDEADTTWETDESAPGFVVRTNDARMLGWAIAAALDPFAPQLENARRLAPQIRQDLSPDAIAKRLEAYCHQALDETRLKSLAASQPWHAKRKPSLASHR